MVCIPCPSIKSIETFDEETIRQKAVFFEKNVSSYQNSVNEAGVNLCLKNPSLLFMKRGDLFNMAKGARGWVQLQGKSHSTKRSFTFDESAPKRSKINSAERLQRINEIYEDIDSIDTQIRFKHRRIEAATATKSYKTCDELSAEIASRKEWRRELIKELGSLEKKGRKSAINMRSKSKEDTRS